MNLPTAMIPPPRPRRVLIVDDSPVDRETCLRFLERAAPAGTYQCGWHGCLEGAVEAARDQRPDCVLLDYRLPDGTGLDFLSRVHAGGGGRDFAVVMLTGVGGESLAAECVRAGLEDYLIKDRLTAEGLHRSVSDAIRAFRARCVGCPRCPVTERMLRESRERSARGERFTASLSHELRTPLTPVLIAGELLRELYGDSGEIGKIASVIRESAARQMRVLDAMLGSVIQDDGQGEAADSE